MNYIPVSEVEKIRDDVIREAASYLPENDAKDAWLHEAYAEMGNKLDALIESATEGVTIEGFTVGLDDVHGAYSLELSDIEYDSLLRFDDKTVTLVLIPDKTVVTEGEKQ